jgi:hypothetical protein
MTAPLVEKRELVLDLWDTDCQPDFVEFAQPNEDDLGDSVNEFWVSRKLWDEMGKPAQVTIKITVGDQLNIGGTLVEGGLDIGGKR